jgi:cell division protein FtsQ
MKKKQAAIKTTRSLAQKRKFKIYFSSLRSWLKWIFILLILIGGYQNKKYALQYLQTAFIELSAICGFKLNNIIIQGRSNFNIKDFLSRFNADNNTPLFSINPAEVKQAIESDSWIKAAIVYRKLPNTLQIKVLERTPIALWQYNKRVFLIDEDGYTMNGDVETFDHLPYFIGEGANVYAASLIKILSQKPSLLHDTSYIIRLGNRRWDLILKNDILVKMPEDNFDKALEYLNNKYTQGVLTDNIKTLDLRDNQKYYIEKR